MNTGIVVVLNGVPRAGKSSIAAALVAAGDNWVNLGVDSVIAETDPSLWPGIGLRPGGERPDLEPLVLSSYCSLFEAVAAAARGGTNVAMDVGLHDNYSHPLNIYSELSRRLAEIPVLFVGVRCTLAAVRERRLDTGYLSWREGEPVPAPVQLWQDSVHAGKTYDLAFDTSTMDPMTCASAILSTLAARRTIRWMRPQR